MREYLQLFRDEVFKGSFVVLKRNFIPGLLMTLIFAILSVFNFKLILDGLGWSLADLSTLQERMAEMSKDMQGGNNPFEFINSLFGNVNFSVLLLGFTLLTLLSSYIYAAFYRLNDNEIRNGDNSFITALKQALGLDILKMFGSMILVSLIMIVAFFIYFMLVGVLMAVSKALAIILAFLLFFVVALFCIRFILAQAAIIHGNMNIIDGIAYSFRFITWKRAGILMLTGLVYIIILLIAGSIISLIKLALFGTFQDNYILFGSGYIFEQILNAAFTIYIYAAMSSIYFRYSNDNRDEDGPAVEEHLIN